MQTCQEVARRAAERLDKTADLLACPGAWTRQAFARNRFGEQVSPEHPKAVCFCVSGGILKCSGNIAESDYVKEIINSENIIDWNDAPERTQAEVIIALRAAADLARQDAAITA